MDAPGHSGADARSGAARVAWVTFLACLAIVPLVSTAPLAGGSGVPLLAHDPDITKFLAVLVLLPACALAWAVSLSAGGRVRVSRAFMPLGAALVWVAIATVAAPDGAIAVFGDGMRYQGLVSYVLYALAFFLGVQLVDSPARVRRAAEIVALAGALGAVHGLLQFAGLDPLGHRALGFEVNRAFGTFGNPDYFAVWQVLTLPVALALALAARTPRRAVLWWATAVLAGIAVLVTFTRGAWIGAIAGVGVLLVSAVRAGWRPRRVDTAMIAGGAGAAVLAALVSLGTGSGVTSVIGRLGSLLDFQDGSALTRLATWRTALGAIAARPVFGFGPDGFELAFSRFRVAEYTRVAGAARFETAAHDWPLQLATTVGIIGAVLVLATVAVTLWRARGYSAGSATRGSGRLVLTGVWAACIGVLVTLLLDVGTVGFMVVLWSMLGVLAAPDARGLTARLPRVAAAFAALALTAALVFGVALGVADANAQRATIALGTPEAPGHALAATGWMPLSSGYRELAGVAWADEMAAEIAASGGVVTPAVTQARDAAVALLEPVATGRRYDFEPWMALVDTQLRYAYASGRQSDFATAEAAGKRAVAALPAAPLLRLALGTAQLELGDAASAAAAAESVLALDSAYQPAIDLLAATRARSN